MRTYFRHLLCTAPLLILACNLSAQYCTPVSNPGSGTNINKVVLQDISNERLWTSGDPGYYDYTQAYKGQTNLRRGLTYNIYITRGTYYSNMRYAAWIDYNMDGDFFDTGEKLDEDIATSDQTVPIVLSFTVPSNTPVLSTRLRIRAVYNYSNLGPCTNYSWGETEDYAVSLIDFDRVNTGLSGCYGEVSFINYEGDTDYDLFLHDETNDLIYFRTNVSGSYNSTVNLTMPDAVNDNLSYNFCDINNDNALDIIVTYRYYDGLNEKPRTVSFQKVSGTLTQVALGLPDLMRGTSAAADLNNDGRQDIIICGDDINKIPRTYIYENTGSGFILANDKLKGLTGKILIHDYDNDCDNDIFISGRDRYGNTNAIIYKNEGNWVFKNIMADLNKVSWTERNSSFCDFNNDGLSDLFLNDKIYRNDGNDTFTEIIIECENYYSGISWDDLDNDGAPELIGKDNFGFVVLKYDGSSKFTVNYHVFTTEDGDLGSGDYNRDNKKDLVVNYYSSLYFLRNYSPVPNNPPAVPVDFRSTVGSAGYYTVKLSWKDGTDDHTAEAGLSYNLRVGTSPGGNNIMSSMTASDNSLFSQGNGNAGYNNSWILRNLAPGTYYWSVQSIDKSGLASPFSTSQQFIIEPPFKTSSFDVSGVISSAGSGADFDGDNDVDLIVYGAVVSGSAPELGIHEQTSPYIYTYHKIASRFEVTSIKDLNNDNLPDIIARYNRDVTLAEKVDSIVIFVNHDNFSFTKIRLDSATYSTSATADFDNDGDIDILVHHYGYYLYKNNGALNFTREKLNIIGTLNRYTALSSIDVDRDNDIDFLVSGKEGAPDYLNHTILYINTGDLNFTEHEFANGSGPTGFMPRSNISVTVPPDIVWNDFNFDGFPDLMITGDDEYNNSSNTIYLNDGAGNFIITELSPRPSDKFSASWIDFNKDGFLDVILPKMGLTVDNSIYLNENNTNYIPFPNIFDDMADAAYVDVIDVDKDNDKDLVFSYRVISGLSFVFRTTIYTNTFNFNNSPPSPPEVLSHDLDNFDIHLNWSKGTDYLMGKEGFTYNIWVGTTPTLPDIVSPMADITTGFRHVEELGNVGTNTSWVLKNLPLGKYYWSVQTIDNSLQGSSWAPVNSFEITALTADFESDIVCLGAETHLTDHTVSTQPVNSWYWDLGNGQFSTQQNPSIIFTKSGMNSVKLIVNAGGLIDSVRKDVFVKPVPVLSFTAPDECQGEVTNFTNTSVLNGTTISSWSWNFGDGAYSSSQNPGTHGYLNPGNYTVTLDAIASNGCSDTYSEDVSVGAYPVAAVTANAPLTFCKGDSVTLSIPHNSSYIYSWKLDGTTLTGADSYKYTAKISGSYVALIINPTGICVTASAPSLVSVLDAPAAPVITADGSVEFCMGDSVGLSVTEFSEHNYSWRLNGGAVGSNKNSYIAKASGDYSLIISNQFGCSAFSTNRISVLVNAKPVTPSVSISGATTFCKGADVTFRVPAITGYTYNWYNEYGPVSGAVSSSFTTGGSGSYFLELSNQTGCITRTPSVKVTVKEVPLTPVLDALNYTKGTCPGEDPVRLSSRLENARYKYSWFKDGQPLQNDTLSYLDLYEAGNYQLKAELNGCYAESALSEIDFPSGPEIPVIYAQGPTFWYLAVSNTSASKYKWYFNGKLIEQANQYFYVANQKLGTYQVSIADTQGCYTKSAPVTIPPGYTGTDEIDLHDNTVIFPNPSRGKFTIALENEIFGEGSIRITSIDGKEIKNLRFLKASTYFSTQIDLGSHSKGNYIVYITLNKYNVVRKVLIE